MAVLDPEKVKSSLLKKGFTEENGDHHFYILFIGGKQTIVRTKVSHNKQDIGDGLISAMSKQLFLKKKQFLDLINCPLSKEKYIKILKNKGKIE